DAPNRLLAAAHWAVTMPLIDNEDLRDTVFLHILSATVVLVPPQRADVQRQVLDCVWEVLPEAMCSRFCTSLVHIPLETEVTLLSLTRYLEAPDREGAQTPAEKLEELICASMYYESKNDASFTASVLCKLLDRYDLPVQIKHREDLARI